MKTSTLTSEKFVRPYDFGPRPEDYGDLLPARFKAKVLVDAETGCWNWTAAMSPGGYGRIGNGPRGSGWSVAHRFAWQKVHNVVLPKAIYLDHLCRNTRCANPAHVEPVTHAENVGRGLQGNRAGLCRRGLHAWTPENIMMDGGFNRCKPCRQEYEKKRNRRRRPNAATPFGLRTHCPQGHEYSEGNTYYTKKGHRICRECHRLRTRVAYRMSNKDRVRNGR